MPKLFWYMCEALIGVVITVYAIYKKKDIYKVSTLLVFYLAIASATWTAEFIVLGLFDSYGYRTGLFTNIWAQNLFGHLILNTTLYPATAVVMVAFSLRYAWIAFAATFFTLSEYLFVKLRVYEQHWWRYYMTFIAVVIFLLVARKWFAKLNQKRYGLIRSITFYFVAMLLIHIPAPVLLLLGKQYYKMSIINNLVGDLYRSSIMIIFFYHLIEAFLLVLFTCVLKKWYWKVLPFIISVVAQCIFAKMGILVMDNGWNLGYTLFIYEIYIAAYILVEKYTLKPDLN